MSIIDSTILRNNLAESIQEVSTKRDYLLVARRGKITSALINIDLFEDLLALGNRDYLNSIKKAREEYKKGKIHSHEDLFGNL